MSGNHKQKGKQQQRGKQSDRGQSTAVASSVITRAVQPANPLSPTLSPLAEGEGAKVSPFPLAGEGPGERERVDAQLPANATLQQQRAHFALTRIKKLADDWKSDTEKQKKFNSYASAMLFMIHANGLGQTAAFYRSKGEKDVHYCLYQLVGKWLSQNLQPFAGKTDLLDGITQSDMDAYLAAQIEAMLLLDWVKKLASAFLAHEEEPSS